MQNSARNNLCVERKTPNNACRAELGRYLLVIKIQKRAVKFYNLLKGSDSQTFHHLQRDEPEEESPKQDGPGSLFTNKTNRTPGQEHN
jgi:hypothetical protein